MVNRWDGETPLEVAVLLDIDGTLAGVYQDGYRPARDNIEKVLAMLSGVAPVILWSMGGTDNCARFLREYPKLLSYVSYIAHKIGFPLELIKHPFCIDDQEADEVVLQCDRIIVDTYYGGKDSGQLLAAARIVVEAIEKLLEKG